MKKKIYILCFCCVLLCCASSFAKTWRGTLNNLASEAGNWDPAGVPVVTDDILLDNTSNNQNMTWNAGVNGLPDTIASWTQTVGYTGIVTIATKYLGQGVFTNFTITGNVNIEGGTWTHPANTGGADEVDRLCVTVDGDFMLGANAVINLLDRGYISEHNNIQGPGKGNRFHADGARAASHGGSGELTLEGTYTYGSITQPDSLGSAAFYTGGGALCLVVAGTATVNGLITAEGRNSHANYGGAAGGSVYLKAANVSGNGTLCACVGKTPGTSTTSRQGGGGGRIAVIATSSGALNNLTMQAFPFAVSAGGGNSGRAGTIYLDTPGFRRVIIDQNNIGAPSDKYTYLPSELGPHTYAPASSLGELASVSLIATNRAFVALSSDLRMDNLIWLSESSHLSLRGHILYFRAAAPAGFPAQLSEPSDDPVLIPAALGGGTIHPEGGFILWDDAPYTLKVPIAAGPYGTIQNYDPEAFYGYGSSLTVTAQPNAGFEFVRWLGSLDHITAGQPEDQTITFTVSNDSYFRAVFANSNPNVKTWFGTGPDANASTTANWHRDIAPVAGDHIVVKGFTTNAWNMDIANFEDRWNAWLTDAYDMNWDININVASWTQNESYGGTVAFFISYPDHGSFTDLTITGDCVISNGVWTHPRCTSLTIEEYRISVIVGGNMFIATNVALDVYGHGWYRGRGPGRTTLGTTVGGSSHGGRGAGGGIPLDGPCYGSVIAPTNLGSGGRSTSVGDGGGAVILRVGGVLDHRGLINADGGRWNFPSPYTAPGSAGSIFLTAGDITGGGVISASTPNAREADASGGGRISLVVTNTTANLADFVPGSNVWARAVNGGGVGTIYLQRGNEATGRGTVYVIGREGDTVGITDIGEPVQVRASPLANYIHGELDRATIRVSGGATLHLTSDTEIGDIWLDTDDATLDLNSYTLHVNSLGRRMATGTIITNGGEIIWLQGAIIRFW